MPSTTAKELSIDAWLSEKPCPKTGPKQRLVHRWIYTAALAANVRGLTPDRAFDVIAGGVANCGRPVSAKEINSQIASAYNATVSASGGPQPNLYLNTNWTYWFSELHGSRSR